MKEAVTQLWNWLNTNAGVLGLIIAILLAVVPGVWAFLRYLLLRNRELQFQRFKVYHQLIRDLVQGDSPGHPPMIDRQIAVVFELRNFPEYYELTLRMLEGLKKQWPTDEPKFGRLDKELDLTMDLIRGKL